MIKLKICTLAVVVLISTIVTGSDRSTNIKQGMECEQNWTHCALSLTKNKLSSSKQPIKIAIMDTGINSDITQLHKYVIKQYNTLDSSSNTSAIHPHGTMIASIIAATSFENSKIGINENIHLYDVQTLDDQANGELDNTVRGIDWAIKQNVDIINMSYGFSHHDKSLENAIKRAHDAGIIILAAAGNTLGLSTDYPARYEEVLSISAIDINKSIYAYAAKGKVDFVAPGVEVPVLNLDGKIESQSGTSFSTAYATAVVSLLLNNEERKNLIAKLEQNSINLGPINQYGNGLIQYIEN